MPSGTQAQRDKDVLDGGNRPNMRGPLYPSFGRFESYYITATDGGGVLTPAAFDTAYTLYTGTTNTTFANTPGDDEYVPWFPQPTTYTDVCLSRTGDRGADAPAGCAFTDVLALFSYTPANWSSRAKILTTLNDPSSWDRSRISPGFVLESVVGGLKRQGGAITAGAALAANFIMAGNVSLELTNDGDQTMEGWEGEWLDFMEVRALQCACALPCLGLPSCLLSRLCTLDCG